MSILIISLPRTGSTELGKKLSIDNDLLFMNEPYDPNKKNIKHLDLNYDKCVVKTILFQVPETVEKNKEKDWLIDLTKKFKKVILLSRKDLVACAESWAFLSYKVKNGGFSPSSIYMWEKTPNYDVVYEYIKKLDSEIKLLSEILNIPITYYEDIFSLTDPNRLRKGNRNTEIKKMI